MAHRDAFVQRGIWNGRLLANGNPAPIPEEYRSPHTKPDNPETTASNATDSMGHHSVSEHN